MVAYLKSWPNLQCGGINSTLLTCASLVNSHERIFQAGWTEAITLRLGLRGGWTFMQFVAT